LARRAEVLGEGGRDPGAPHAHERGRVARGDDHDAPGEALRSELVLEVLADLAAPLADERGHDHVGVRVARDLPEERALADAAAREEADALTLAEGGEAVDRADPRGQWATHASAGQRVGRGARHRPLLTLDRRAAIDRV